MLQNLISSLKADTSNDATQTKRRYPRRSMDSCVVVIHGQTFPVENWSLSGLLLQADDRLFGIHQDIDFVVKFKLRNTILDVGHRGSVVRKADGKVALHFEPLSQTISRKFQQVIDDHVAGEFANSQV